MAKYIIKLETDNDSIEEIEACFVNMIQNHLDCTDAFYDISKEGAE